MLSRPYVELLRQARRVTRRADEAEDLLQTILLSAVEAGRSDLSSLENRRWLRGALRRRAAFDARTAIRRNKRDDRWAGVIQPMPGDRDELPGSFLAALPPPLRTTALLVLSGHTRQEIAWLQRLSDPALRQRFAEIKRRWRDAGNGRIEDMTGLSGKLNFGCIRRSLLGLARGEGVMLASHDPDGHLFVIGSLTNCVTPATGKRTSNHQE